ncbi:hypothetical protein CSB09_02030 [Candidatus Gracilibacteria bacterium]|nr:MAG: hypothetical protein CSB09_02030 [Candidatus Gracilibacteria bacterium]
MQKTTFNISLNPELKEQFFQLAKSLETTPTNILNMYIKQVVKTRKISFSDAEDIDYNLYQIEYQDLPEKAKKEYDTVKDWTLEDFENNGYSSLV